MKNLTNIKQRILYFIENQNINVSKFYSESGVSYGILTQKSKISEDNIVKFLTTYPVVNPEWLLIGKGKMFRSAEPTAQQPEAIKSPTGIPLVSIAAVGGFGNAEFAIKESDVKDYYVVPKFKDRRIDFMIEVAGSSMQPKYNSGDVVACTILKESRFIQWGKVHVIGTREQGILIKRLYPCDNMDKKCVKCQSDNEKYPPFDITHDEITGIAIVVGVIRLE
ncbi:MAG: hypothetical protein LBN98_03690 [Prevotellaceae bacterium]|jgi:phage repressor protein C with HTH and peptisase S24 domain|nr:hypothetical protein [Prevotellaceae bacterium]